MTLRELFTPLVVYVLFFGRSTSERGKSFAEVRGAVERLIAEQRQVLRRYELAQADYDLALFAAVAWADEQILQGAQQADNHELAEPWKRNPLQAGLYNTANAGEEFFQRLDKIGPAQKQVVEIYHLVLCLGFRGRYYAATNEYRLNEIKRECATRLPERIHELLDFEKDHITPQLYAVAPVVRQPLRRQVSSAWLIAPAAVALALGGLIIWWFLRGPSQSALVKAISGFECADIRIGSVHRRVVTLSGHVASVEQAASAKREVAGVPRVREVRDTFKVIPTPFCEVMELLAPYRRLNQSKDFELTIHPDKGCGATYHGGDDLKVEVTATNPLHHIYLDYYAADREMVTHLLPNKEQPDEDAGADSTVVGGRGAPTGWTIQPPFGREMITVIASAQPLFTPARTKPETAKDYIAALRQGLTRHPGVYASYCFTTTVGPSSEGQ